jgi:subtilase family serine protease
LNSVARGTVVRSAVLALAALSLAVPASASADPPPGPGHSGIHHKRVCPGPASPRSALCHAQVVTDTRGRPLVTTGPAGYGPADLQSAYNVASAAATVGGSQTIAIVDAYDDPSAEADMGVYRSQYGLPPCTSANGCFRRVNQSGGTTAPAANASWGQEISLDLDMASAICPSCKVLLVEASSNSFADLSAAVDRAAAMGATQISNSYGGGEYLGEASDQSHYNHPGVDITVSSGDNGYRVEFPAASQFVTAVGGTTLNRASNARGWSESVWSGAGSGCSSYVAKPSWQSDGGCAKRTVADVAADADPNTGVAVYDSYAYQGTSGWLVFGGTSAAAPIVAGVDALSGGRSPGSQYGSFPYSNPSYFWDVTAGSNGSCPTTYLCNGVAGYDGPTGMGTPNGSSAAQPPAPPVNTSPPTIAGTTTQGQTLTANPGSWAGSPSPTYTYQWQQCSSGTCTDIAGATAQTYTLTSGDVGKTIDVVVTGTNSSGSSAATSAQSAAIAPAPADFSLSASPSSATMTRNGSASDQVAINPVNGFTGSVTLSVSGYGAGVTPRWSQNPATSGSTLTLTGTNAQLGTYTLTISGTDGTNTHTARVTLKVTKK